MLGDLWGGASDLLGDTLSSILESILNATIFKLCYYIERMLCWIIGILTDLFNVFAGLDTVTYNGRQSFLINIFFANKAINNIFWGMAIIGFILIFVFTTWSVIRKMFDLSGKHQESLGQIIWSGIRSIFLIIGLTLIVNVVLEGTGRLMQQIDFIFNNAYHLDQPQEREFTDEEYATMGRVLATIGNYSMVPASNSRYNLNACFNAIRGDMENLQKAGIFDYSYYSTDSEGKEEESWQSVLLQIAKSTDLSRDVMIDVYNEGVASSITYAMNYLKNTANPLPLDHAENTYTVTERAPLDRMIFLMGTMRAAKNTQYNKNPAFDDALRGPYYYNEGRDIYSFKNVNSDFEIGFETDYILVWLAAVAIIVDLTIVILNCIARIFNMLFLYIIAPPIIAVSPLDNGGKFKQWTTAFLVQSLSVFATVIAMRLLLIYLPIVCSPQLVLFEKPVLNAIGKFFLVFGGVEAAKKSTGLLTGILADSAGMEAIRSGDMSTTAGRMVGAASGLALGVAGKAAGIGLATLNFATKPVQNLAGRAWNATGGKLAEAWTNLGKGDTQGQKAMQSAKDRLAAEKAYDKLTSGEKGGSPSNSPQDKNSPDKGGNPPGEALPNQQHPEQPDHNDRGGNGPQGGNPQQQPPPLPGWFGRQAAEAPAELPHSNSNLNAARQKRDIGMSADEVEKANRPEGRRNPASRDDSTLPSSANRPSLDGPPQQRNRGAGQRQGPPRNNDRQGPRGGVNLPNRARPPQDGNHLQPQAAQVQRENQELQDGAEDGGVHPPQGGHVNENDRNNPPPQQVVQAPREADLNQAQGGMGNQAPLNDPMNLNRPLQGGGIPRPQQGRRVSERNEQQGEDRRNPNRAVPVNENQDAGQRRGGNNQAGGRRITNVQAQQRGGNVNAPYRAAPRGGDRNPPPQVNQTQVQPPQQVDRPQVPPPQQMNRPQVQEPPRYKAPEVNQPPVQPQREVPPRDLRPDGNNGGLPGSHRGS